MNNGGGSPPWQVPEANAAYISTQSRIAPPPPSYHYLNYQRPVQQQQSHQGYHPPFRSSFICEQCDRYFKTKHLLELHEAEDHVLCDFAACEWSGPPGNLLAHKLTHIKTEKGEAVLASVDEAALWLAARRRARALAKARSEEERKRISEAHPLKLSVLEQTLRSRGNSRVSQGVDRRAQSVLVPELARFTSLFENRRRDLRGTTILKKIPASASTYPICPSVLYGKPCPCPERCKKLHDLSAYRKWKAHRDKTGARLRGLAQARQAMTYTLLADSIQEYEELLLMALNSIYVSNFFGNLRRAAG